MNQLEPRSILDRFNNEPEELVFQPQPNEDYKAFGVSPHTSSLNCIKKSGNQIGISWSLYCDARYSPTNGIEIEFTHKLVFIKGHDLLQLYHSILGNRVTYVAEADRPTAKLCIEEGESVVTELIVDNRIDGKSGA